MGEGCERHARFYRRLGYNPIPSRSNGRGGLIPYAAFWDSPLPEEAMPAFRRTPNLQVMTGARWGLCGIDLDGPGSVAVWKAWKAEHGCPDTWTVRTGSGNYHLWFALPSWLPECPSRRAGSDPLWTDGAKHSAIELLGEHGLLVAPPSLHHRTRKPYAWLPGRGPRDMSRPATVPAWVLSLPSTKPPPVEQPLPPLRRRTAFARGGKHYDWREVLAAIPDKVELVKGWGLRLAVDSPNAAGWIPCHAIGREDDNPSASFNRESGYYSEPFTRRLCLFWVGVELGLFADWPEAVDAMGAEFIG
jgi:hypothetical protein